MESRTGQASPDAKSDRPKPTTHVVFVDPAASIEDLCRKAGITIDERLLGPDGKLKELGEWPDKPFDHGDKGKSKPNGTLVPYTAVITDGSGTVGKPWDKAKASAAKEGQSGINLREGIALVIDRPEILDEQRIALPATTSGIYDILQIEKRKDGAVILSPLFVGDTNTDWVTYKKGEDGEEQIVNGVVIKEGQVATKAPFAVIFAKSRNPQVPGA